MRTHLKQREQLSKLQVESNLKESDITEIQFPKGQFD